MIAYNVPKIVIHKKQVYNNQIKNTNSFTALQVSIFNPYENHSNAYLKAIVTIFNALNSLLQWKKKKSSLLAPKAMEK